MGRQHCGLEHAGHCSGLQENYSGKLFFLSFKGRRETNVFRDLCCSNMVYKRMGVAAADSVPIWGSDFAFSSLLKNHWW